jgi:aspartate carbamoyltransferase catalytic subunit
MNIEAMQPDMIVMRHASSGAGHLLSRVCKSRIINAGDGMHEHRDPGAARRLHDSRAQATHRRPQGHHRRRPAAQPGAAIERQAADQAGREVWVSGPPTFVPSGIGAVRRARFSANIGAVADADVIMMLRIQQERMNGAFIPSLREYFNTFGMTAARVAKAKPDVIIMHPGPMNRGVEIASDVADGPYSVILEQVANGVAVRMAVLYLLAGGVEVD